jgi:hypothetical protein
MKRGLSLDSAGRLKVSEADIEKACTQILELDGWRPLKTNPCSDRSRGKGFGEVGMADYLYMRCVVPGYAEVMWIEWKRPGGRLAPAQRAWIEKERGKGGQVYVAGEAFPASIEGFSGWYNRWFKRKSVI